MEILEQLRNAVSAVLEGFEDGDQVIRDVTSADIKRAMVREVAGAVLGIRPPLERGVDWDIFDCDGYENVQRVDEFDTCTDDEACEEARKLGIETDSEGYVIREGKRVEVPRVRQQRTGEWRESLNC